MSTLKTRRKDDFPYRCPTEFEAKYYMPNYLQVESAVLRTRDRYPRRKSVWPALFALFVMAAAFYGIIKLVIGI